MNKTVSTLLSLVFIGIIAIGGWVLYQRSTVPPVQLPSFMLYVEPLHRTLLSDLLSTPPVDLVTSIESTKQLLQDRQAIAPAAQRPVYEKAIRHLESMVPLARERTKALQQVARSSRFESRLDRPDSSPASSFFTAPVARRWQELAAQWRPALDRSFVELRRAEAQWSAVGPGVPALRPAGTPVYIRPAPERMNPLDRGSYYR